MNKVYISKRYQSDFIWKKLDKFAAVQYIYKNVDACLRKTQRPKILYQCFISNNSLHVRQVIWKTYAINMAEHTQFKGMGWDHTSICKSTDIYQR